MIKFLTVGIGVIAGIAKLLDLLLPTPWPHWIRIALWAVLGIIFALFLLLLARWILMQAIDYSLRERAAQRGYATAIDDDLSSDSTARIAYVFNARLYGMEYERLLIRCTVRDDGSAVISRDAFLRAHSVITDMDQYLLFPQGSREDLAHPEPVAAEPIDTPRQLTRKITELTTGKRALRISVKPPLAPGERLNYRLTERSGQGLFDVTGQEHRKIPDYVAWDISRPTKELELLVRFPDDFRPEEVWTDVWYAVGQSESTHALEFRRVSGLLHQKIEGINLNISLKIPLPILGLTYVILWRPPEAGQVNTGSV